MAGYKIDEVRPSIISSAAGASAHGYRVYFTLEGRGEQHFVETQAPIDPARVDKEISKFIANRDALDALG